MMLQKRTTLNKRLHNSGLFVLEIIHLARTYAYQGGKKC